MMGLPKYKIEQYARKVLNLISGQGRNFYDHDSRDEYYNMSPEERFRKDLDYCAETKEEFYELLLDAFGYYDEDDDTCQYFKERNN